MNGRYFVSGQTSCYSCNKLDGPLTTCGPSRIRSIIESSRQRNDSLHEDLERRLHINPDLSVQAHRNCVSSYMSKSHIKRAVKRDKKDAGSSPLKRVRRSESHPFDFLTQCLFCGEDCPVNPDPKNPSRWRKASLVRTADSANINVKEAIQETCSARNDS